MHCLCTPASFAATGTPWFPHGGAGQQHGSDGEDTSDSQATRHNLQRGGIWKSPRCPEYKMRANFGGARYWPGRGLSHQEFFPLPCCRDSELFDLPEYLRYRPKGHNLHKVSAFSGSTGPSAVLGNFTCRKHDTSPASSLHGIVVGFHPGVGPDECCWVLRQTHLQGRPLRIRQALIDTRRNSSCHPDIAMDTSLCCSVFRSLNLDTPQNLNGSHIEQPDVIWKSSR